jgi:hypothetical protein
MLRIRLDLTASTAMAARAVAAFVCPCGHVRIEGSHRNTMVDCAVSREEIAAELTRITDQAMSDDIRSHPSTLDGVSRKLWIAIQRSTHSKSKFGSFARLQVRL